MQEQYSSFDQLHNTMIITVNFSFISSLSLNDLILTLLHGFGVGFQVLHTTKSQFKTDWFLGNLLFLVVW